MSDEEFMKIMEEIDRKLSEEAVPISRRVFFAHFKISKITGDKGSITEIPGVEYPPYVGPSLTKSISEWYSKRWGDRAQLSTTVGKIPISLRGEIFISRIPLVYGNDDQSPILRTIDGITSDFVNSLTEDEEEMIRKTFQDGYNLVYEIDTMKGLARSLEKKKDDHDLFMLIQNAIEDCNKAVQCLYDRSDTNGSRFHSQQFAEKMLKGYLIKNGRAVKHNHKLKTLLKDCKSRDSSFSEVEAEVDNLSKIQMTIRYSDPKSSLEKACNDFWDSLHIGGFCACKLTNSPRRFRK